MFARTNLLLWAKMITTLKGLITITEEMEPAGDDLAFSEGVEKEVQKAAKTVVKALVALNNYYNY